MTQDEIIRMAREAGFAISPERYLAAHQCTTADLERFAALVAAHEREKYSRIQDHLSDAEEIIQRMMREREATVLAEREACAKVCEKRGHCNECGGGEQFAAAIRARSDEL